MNESLLSAPTLLAAAEEVEAPEGWNMFIYVGIVVLAMLGLVIAARKGYTPTVFTTKLASCAEQLYLFLEGFAIGIIGPHGRKYMTVLCTYWLFIFCSNCLGLFANHTPTAIFSLNMGLSISAVLYVQWEGMKANGVFGHIKHFTGPKLTGALLLVSGMIFLIEIVSEAMKMLSLSLRLYGNIHGGHEVVKSLNDLGNLHLGGLHIELPVGGLLLPIKLLTAIVQALVFTLLLSVYLGLVTHHDTEHTPKEVPGTEGNPEALEPVHV
jgi:F-type H+-transporting ATPase subunit a